MNDIDMMRDMSVDQLRKLAKSLMHQLSAEVQVELMEDCLAAHPLSA